MSDEHRDAGSDAMRDLAAPPRVRVWRRRDGTTIEHCRLREAGDEDEGPQLDGAVVGTLDGRPLRAEYAVAFGLDWRTRFVEVVVAHGGDVRRLELAADGDGRWWRDGVEVPALAGCLDVDLALTPATNTLPIRRLALAVGEGRDVTAAWVRVPSLDVEVLPQRYTRLDERRWRYESAHGAFVAELDVDGAGLVVRYGDIWEAVDA